MSMVIRTYTQTMPVLCVIFKGWKTEGAYRVSAAGPQDSEKTLTLKDKDGNVLGVFCTSELAGSHIDAVRRSTGCGMSCQLYCCPR